MPSGVYNRTAEHRKKLSETNKRLGIKPPAQWGVKKTQYQLDCTSKTHKGKKMSKETIEKIVSKTRGRKQSAEERKMRSLAQKKVIEVGRHNFWKGGISTINKTARNLFMMTVDYKIWRTSVFERDNYTCVWCGARNGNGKTVILHADHIKSYALFPELRTNLDNGRTLCIDCHKKTDSYAGRNRIKKLTLQI